MADFGFPIVQPVPAQPGVGPQWYDDNPTTWPREYDDWLDDIRWRGAASHSFGNGVDDAHVIFRGLNVTESGTRWLLLSWNVKATSEVAGAADAVYVGFSSGDGQPAIIVSVQLNAPVPAFLEAGDDSNYTAQIVHKPSTVGSDWSSPDPAPSWVTDRTRLWIAGTSSSKWAVQMAVPLDTELSAYSSSDPDYAAHSVILNESSFKMWYAVYLGMPIGAELPDGTPVLVVEYPWPGMPSDTTTYPQDPTGFGECCAATSASDLACTATGISIRAADIGTRNPDGTARPTQSKIHVDLTNTPPTADVPEDQNMFFAIPTWYAGITPDRQAAIRARFRLANWGSTVGDLTPESWTDVPYGQGTEVYDQVKYDDPPGVNECRFIWPRPEDLPATDLDPPTSSSTLIDDIRTGVKTTHQCMLVELFSVYHLGETFTRNSVYRNMDFVEASEFEREAEISVRGLHPVGHRSPGNVYLYVETRNLPASIDPERDQRPKEPERQGDPTRRDQLQKAPESKQAYQEHKTPGIDEIAEHMPTYRVHVYHDTGRKTTLFGKGGHPVLRPQTSFGYFVRHEGPLYGWRHWLDGRDVDVQQIGPNLFKIAMPEEGIVKIATGVQAIETKDELDQKDGDKEGCLWRLIEWIKGLFKSQ